MIRIAFVHNRFPAGGAERVTMDIASYLKLYGGYEVFVYASRISETLLNDAMLSKFTLRRIPTQFISSKRTKQIERYIIEDEIDILVQPGKAIPGIERIKERTGVKTIVACHGEPFWQRYVIMHRRQKGFFRKLMWHLFNKRRYEDGTLAMRMAVARTRRDYETSDAYTVLCQSYIHETASVLDLVPEKSHIYAIENSERPVENVNYNKENIILFVGRFENWSKRIDRLLRIWHSVQDRMSDWKLVLVGDGDDWHRMRKLSEAMHLQRIHFEGRQNNVAEYYQKASVVALTSDTEGWGLALTEGQAMGCIGVAFGCTSGVKEVLSPNSECGFVVPPFEEGKYADTLLAIAAMDDNDRLKIRQNAVAKRLMYVPDVISEKWRVLFEHLKNN
ncbi:MAG: glycosyltransferase [Bacteroidaceae bacterium]|nr:glycosyltransferase [Bacteroidaceae bacterium]